MAPSYHSKVSYIYGNRFHPVFFFTIGSKQKKKKKTRNTMAPLYHSKVSSIRKTREFHFSLVWVMEFSIISTCLSKVNFFLITLACQS